MTRDQIVVELLSMVTRAWESTLHLPCPDSILWAADGLPDEEAAARMVQLAMVDAYNEARRVLADWEWGRQVERERVAAKKAAKEGGR